ncbi:unnamed protein product [Echinostoma caproni]|uniref:Alpha-amylase n=1 Tax=Echinostoma caproni TaxID=27848 RepID=A0A183AA54_9TREM|nr:unnamed protein product [Echinostoma caproni]
MHTARMITMLNRIDLGLNKQLRFAPDVDHSFRRTVYANVPTIQIDFAPEQESQFCQVMTKHEDYYVGNDWAYEGNLTQSMHPLSRWPSASNRYVFVKVLY